MQTDPIQIASEMGKKIELLVKSRAELRKYAHAKALSIAEYDRELAIAILKLKNGKAVQVGDEVAKDVPATVMKEIAKGAIWESCNKKELAEVTYKSAITAAEMIMAELNGLQSVNRYLDVSPNHGRVQ